MEDFYVTLPSNVKSSENNTIAEYTTQLKKRINFNRNEKWKVGLAEITYTKSWYNIRNNIKIAYFNNQGEYLSPSTYQIHEKNGVPDTMKFFMIKPTYFQNIESLINELDKVMKGELDHLFEEPPSIQYDNFRHRVRITPGVLKNQFFYPLFTDEVNLILGLVDTKKLTLYDSIVKKIADSKPMNEKEKKWLTQIFPNSTYEGERCVELNAAMGSIYVYCNIIDHSIVGDEYVQLLKIVKVPNQLNFGDNVNIQYDIPHYIPLQTNTIDSIVLELRDDTSELIPFEFGRVTIKLAFKKYV